MDDNSRLDAERSSPAHAARSARARRGFTLLELVVVMSILALLAGAAVPVARRILDSAARRATREELEVLAEAVAECFRDTGRLPKSLAELLDDPGAPGWTGPYVEVMARDPHSGESTAVLDAWLRPYALERESASRVRLVSAGLDAGFDADDAQDATDAARDDLVVVLDVTPIRRARTLELLRTLNGALERFNSEHPSPGLPAEPAAILARLVQAGYLPASEPWSRDGWDEPFVCDPPGATPVLRMTSRHLAR